jgi:SAM-dependent methyltransferase
MSIMEPMASDSSVAGTACPLCGSAGGSVEGRLPYEQIWRRLRDVWNVELSEPVRRAHAPAEATVRVRCTSCGLERFEPLCPGNAEFYRELMAIVPYNADRWEFRIVRGRLAPEDAIVDLGCGHGSFLRSLGRRAGRTVGIDHHRPSIERLAASGVEAYSTDFESFASAHAGAFDVATCFHVVEHVRDPLAAVRAARACLRPGGRLFVSVPNKRRALRGIDEPLDCPPHHITRWEAEQLHVLASRAGLRVERVHIEPPDISVFRVLSRRAVTPWLAWAPEGLSRFVGRAWGRVAGAVRHKAIVGGGRYLDKGLFGHSMMAELSRDG